MDWKYPIGRRDFLKLAGAASLALFGVPDLGGAKPGRGPGEGCL